MIFKNIVRAGEGYGDNRTIGFFGDLHTAFLEGKHFLALIAGAFGTEKDRNSMLYIVNGFQNGIQTGL